MSQHHFGSEMWDESAEDIAPLFHLLGVTSVHDVELLQRYIAHDTLVRGDGRIVVLLCEHSAEITVGRSGSRRHVRLNDDELRRRQIKLRWVDRSGGCVFHRPGQLAIYPLVPLSDHRWTLAECQNRLQQGLQAALMAEGFAVEGSPPLRGLSGRTGPLAVMGMGQRDGVTHSGAWLNVNPEMLGYNAVDLFTPQPQDCLKTDSQPATTMSCLLAERRLPVRMAAIRAAVMKHVARAFGGERYHVITGHPRLVRKATRQAVS